MAISLFQILTKLLTSTIDITKDFIMLNVLALMSKVSVSCDQNAFKHQGVEVASMELVKWILYLIKDKNLS